MGGCSRNFLNASKFSKSILGKKLFNICVNEVGFGFDGYMVVM